MKNNELNCIFFLLFIEEKYGEGGGGEENILNVSGNFFKYISSKPNYKGNFNEGGGMTCCI